MAVSYKKVFHLLVDRDMTAGQLQQQAGYSANITTRFKKNAYISLQPFFDADIRDYIENVRRSHEQVIDSVNIDTVLFGMPYHSQKL